MADAGVIKMLAQVSQDTNVLLYSDLAKIPERKRVKHLIALAQLGQLAEMAAKGVQIIPSAFAQALPEESSNAHSATPAVLPGGGVVALEPPLEQPAPTPAPAESGPSMASQQETGERGRSSNAKGPSSSPPPTKRRRAGHEFKVNM
ncbi:TPA: hypothetical protein SL561_000758 [Pseudomonas aeruginosa]|nr:hypothetical protein [Pseudomonas aeruginosa]